LVKAKTAATSSSDPRHFQKQENGRMGRFKRKEDPVALKTNGVSFGFAAPAVILYTGLLIIPILIAFAFSFTSWNGIALSTPKFVGLRNYVDMFSDARLGNAIVVTLTITVVVVISVNVIGLFLAMFLNNAGRVTNVSRSIFFSPYVLSTVAISFIWLSILSYTGVLNGIFEALGWDSLVQDYIGSKSKAIACICVVEIWRCLGFHMVIYLAALQTVPTDLYEACTVDGGNAWHRFRYVTLPLIVPGITISFLMSLINELRMYDIVKVLTDGGPGYDTETITYNIVTQAFGNTMLGYSSAIAVFLFALIATVAIIQIKVSSKKEVEL
jgi:ABC-type sugar transport system permease subunit